MQKTFSFVLDENLVRQLENKTQDEHRKSRSNMLEVILRDYFKDGKK